MSNDVNKTTFVSIIIPAKNEEKHIVGCIDSIYECDYPRDSFEVIVMDNGSSDLTVELAKGKGARVFISPESTISGLRNIGASTAAGDILAFIDADCLVTKMWISSAVENLRDNNVIACGSAPIVEENGTWVQKTWEFNVTSHRERTVINWMTSMNLFVKKEQFHKVKGFDEMLKTCEDVDLSYRLNKYGKIVSDKKIKAIHLGEPKTIKEFYLKELWRGQSNFEGAFRHGITLDELPTLVMPIYIVIALGLLIFSTFFNKLFLYSLFILVLPGILLAVKKCFLKKDFSHYFKLILLYEIFFIARTLAVFYRAGHRSAANPKTFQTM